MTPRSLLPTVSERNVALGNRQGQDFLINTLQHFQTYRMVIQDRHKATMPTTHKRDPGFAWQMVRWQSACLYPLAM